MQTLTDWPPSSYILVDSTDVSFSLWPTEVIFSHSQLLTLVFSYTVGWSSHRFIGLKLALSETTFFSATLSLTAWERKQEEQYLSGSDWSSEVGHPQRFGSAAFSLHRSPYSPTHLKITSTVFLWDIQFELQLIMESQPSRIIISWYLIPHMLVWTSTDSFFDLWLWIRSSRKHTLICFCSSLTQSCFKHSAHTAGIYPQIKQIQQTPKGSDVQ